MRRRWIVAGGIVAGAMVVIVAGCVYALLRYKLYYAPAGSMEPTIKIGQTFVVDRFAYRDVPPRRGDVVVFMPPLISDKPFFKRVVAVPGDRLAIRKGRTFLNGKLVDEPYTMETSYDLVVRNYDLWVDGERVDRAFAIIPPRAGWTAPDTVPRGCYVVLGDNRPNSEDSHVFGFFCPGQPVPNQPKVHPALVGRAILPSP